MSKPARKPAARDICKSMADGIRRSVTASPVIDESGRLTPAAFADRFERVSRTLWCIAAGIVGDRAAADDIVQESAMIALGKLSQFDPGTNFMAWMARIVRFVALNYSRRRGGASASMDPDALEHAPAATASGRPSTDPTIPATLNWHGELLPDQAAFDDRLQAALNQLEPPARACLLLRVVLDMPYRDIARALDMAEGTAMSHVHRSRLALRQTLSHDSDICVRSGDAHAAR